MSTTTLSTQTHSRARRGTLAIAASIAAAALAACSAEAKPGQPSAPPSSTQPGPTTSAVPASTAGASTSPTVPTGLPSDWSSRAIQAATAAVTACAQATTLLPPRCPQSADPLTLQGVTVAHWTTVGQPLSNATAVSLQQIDPSGVTTGQGNVGVYGRYGMTVSYTAAGQIVRPYRDYTGGLSYATMTWDGQSFQNVEFQPVSISLLPSGLTIAPFTRPTAVTDPMVIAAVSAGFRECVAIKPPLPPNPVTPGCPQQSPGLDPNTVSAQWRINGDPMQGAVVAFDPEKGDFVATGSYDMTVDSVIAGVPYAGPRTNRETGTYSATLIWDGHQLTLLNIAGSSSGG